MVTYQVQSTPNWLLGLIRGAKMWIILYNAPNYLVGDELSKREYSGFTLGTCATTNMQMMIIIILEIFALCCPSGMADRK